MKILSVIIILILGQNIAFAIRESRATAIDSRIRIMNYHPNDVYRYVGYYKYQTSIEFGKNEEIASISMGDTTAWQVIPSGNRIFLKPTDTEATTNMTLITNKRTYFFELSAQEAVDIRDPNMAFNIKFIYPDEEGSGEQIQNFTPEAPTNTVDLSHPEKLNFLYSISGDEEIAPLKIFDDGEFTYIHFRDTNSELPAVFAVDKDLRESMVNIKSDPENNNILIVEQVFPKLTLRSGKKIVCIFNESFRPF